MNVTDRGGLKMMWKAGRFCPVVVCSHCGKRIEDAKRCNVEWLIPDKQELAGPAAVYFTHKGCCRAFEAANGGGALWGATELQAFVVYLGDNLHLDWEKARESAVWLAEL